MSDISRAIYEKVFIFSKSKGNIPRATTDIKDGVPVKINDNLTLVSYVVDHSRLRCKAYTFDNKGRQEDITYTETLEITVTRANYYRIQLEK